MPVKKFRRVAVLTVIIVLHGFGVLRAHGDGSDDTTATNQSTTSNQTPYAENSTKNFEIVINYNDVIPNKETKVTVFISDFNLNIPISNAKVELEITGINDDKIKPAVLTGPGIYEFSVEFPEIKKYDFLFSIKSGAVEDLIPINEVDISKKEQIKDKNTAKLCGGVFSEFF